MVVTYYVCIPHLKKVLEAIERIELCSIKQSFCDIEEALTDFLEKLQDYKEELYSEKYQLEDYFNVETVDRLRP